MKIRHIVSLALVALLAAWMLVPFSLSEDPDDRYATESGDRVVRAVGENSDEASDSGDFLVRVARIEPQTYVDTVLVRGRTEARRHVTVRAETTGRVVETPVPRGDRVEQGDVLCRLETDSRQADLQEARSQREQARLEHEAGQDLENRGLQSRAELARLKSALDSAEAAVERAELELERTRIRAPFGGIMDSRAVEAGDYINVGGDCASVLDDEPMLLTGQVAEHQIDQLILGAPVQARLIDGRTVTATLSYISRTAQGATRSYRIEAEVQPSEEVIRQGMTAEMNIAANEIEAHLIPPSALSLDDNGEPGVKTVDAENRVHFQPVTIVGENTQEGNSGFWVTGLSQVVNLITLGQELVFQGQTVRTNFDWSPAGN